MPHGSEVPLPRTHDQLSVAKVVAQPHAMGRQDRPIIFSVPQVGGAPNALGQLPAHSSPIDGVPLARAEQLVCGREEIAFFSADVVSQRLDEILGC